jgi:hypothetical protein
MDNRKEPARGWEFSVVAKGSPQPQTEQAERIRAKAKKLKNKKVNKHRNFDGMEYLLE